MGPIFRHDCIKCAHSIRPPPPVVEQMKSTSGSPGLQGRQSWAGTWCRSGLNVPPRALIRRIPIIRPTDSCLWIPGLAAAPGPIITRLSTRMNTCRSPCTTVPIMPDSAGQSRWGMQSANVCNAHMLPTWGLSFLMDRTPWRIITRFAECATSPTWAGCCTETVPFRPQGMGDAVWSAFANSHVGRHVTGSTPRQHEQAHAGHRFLAAGKPPGAWILQHQYRACGALIPCKVAQVRQGTQGLCLTPFRKVLLEHPVCAILCFGPKSSLASLAIRSPKQGGSSGMRGPCPQ